jgi:AmmeMemoRadiSam system protein A
MTNLSGPQDFTSERGIGVIIGCKLSSKVTELPALREVANCASALIGRRPMSGENGIFVETGRTTGEERQLLLSYARLALEESVAGKTLTPLDLDEIPARLRENGASFVTLMCSEQLRGCVGSLEPVRPLVEDVRLNAVAAAIQDFRFPPVRPDEVGQLSIHISLLTVPVALDYAKPDDLLMKLRPGIDGVVLREGFLRATFLPQVWEKIPDPDLFLSLLSQKMGAPANYWRIRKMDVLTYQVEEICE